MVEDEGVGEGGGRRREDFFYLGNVSCKRLASVD